MKNDKALFELIVNATNGVERAFNKLVTLYSKRVHAEISKFMKKNDFHKILYVDYELAVDDVAATVWLEMFKTIKKGKLSFETINSFNNYLEIVCRHRTYRFMSKRIRNRTKKGSQINNRHEHSDDINHDRLIRDNRINDVNTKNVRFESIEEIGTLELAFKQSPEQEVAEEQLSRIILDNLTEKERQVLELILEKDLQVDVARDLAVDVRTVFNRVKMIEAKSRKHRGK
ncbi:sigma-70 family RNA polymerase sigma factor [Vibrio splendidus]|uniref:sigma-70 family RNA polymerase sigma factor n=1 Tax=Vibrio splendidus TaxID=29497 RepID=UPI001054DD01|nr:sigma-70 family RNA polymerase sigma factor [Vibrio splendidus]